MSFLLKRSGFTLTLVISCFTLLFGYQNCGKVRFDRQASVGAQCTDAEILAGTCGVSCSWTGDNRVNASPTSFTGQGTVSGTVNFTIPDNVGEIEKVIFDFDDGTDILVVQGGNQVVQHNFSSNVTKQYDVQVSVVKLGEQNCSTSQTIVITINTGDNCLISTELSGPNRGIVNQILGYRVNMTSCPNSGYTIDWDKNNDNVTELQTVNNPEADLSWNAPGTYRIKTTTNFPGLISNVYSYKDVIISCPAGSSPNGQNVCICYSTGQGVPDTGVCPPCPGGSTASDDRLGGACVCPAGQTYDPTDRRCECPSGNAPINGSCAAPTCSVTVNGQTVTRNEGETLTLHRRDNAGSVSCGFTCSSQSRTCRSGQFVNNQNQPLPFDPGYIYTEQPACVASCGNCNLALADGTLTAGVGETRTVYKRQNLSCGATCGSEVLTCGSSQQFVNAAQQPITNGSTYYLTQGTCTVPCQTCTVVGYPGVTSLELNQSLTMYSSSGVACGAKACASQTLTCSTGGQTLTFGSQYTHTNSASCVATIPACAQNCSVTGYPGVTTLAPGQSLTGYSNSGVTCGSNSCTSVSRSCPSTGGVALTFPSGTQATNAACVPTIPSCPPTDVIGMHLSKVNNDYAFASPATVIKVTDVTYSYIKLRSGERSFRLCHKINGTPSCTSESQFVNVSIQAGSNGSYNFVGTNAACNPGNPVSATLYTGVSGYDIFKVTNNCTGAIGTYGDQITSTGKKGTASDSFTYRVEGLTCPTGQFVETHRETGEKFCARLGDVDGQFCSGSSANSWTMYSNRSSRPNSQRTCAAASASQPVDYNYADLWWVHQDRNNDMFHQNIGTCSGTTACAISANVDIVRVSNGQFIYTRNISSAADVQHYLGSTKCTSTQTAYACTSNPPAQCPACPAGQTWDRSSCRCTGGGTTNPPADAAVYVSNVSNPSSNVTSFTTGQTVYMRGTNVHGATRAQGCIVTSATNSNLAACSNFATLGSDWNCSGTTCTNSSNQYPALYYKACLKNPNTGSTACTPTFRVQEAVTLAPQPTLHGCYVDTMQWDVTQDGGTCESEGCTTTNYITFSVGDERSPTSQYGDGDHFRLKDRTKYSVTWTGDCTGTYDFCSVIKTSNRIYRATAVVRRLADNQTWTYNFTANKRTRLASGTPPRCSPTP